MRLEHPWILVSKGVSWNQSSVDTKGWLYWNCYTRFTQCIQFIKIAKKISEIQLNSFNFTKILTLLPCRTHQLKWSVICHTLVCFLLKFNNIWSKCLNCIDFKYFPLVYLVIIGLLGSGLLFRFIFPYKMLFKLCNQNYCLFRK